ncbi:MAG: hypothetical protein H6570_12945 [Lewinellaceae bacterium]|nr:hypothetical protein [Lewinellaceae bacterium]
MKIPFRAFTLLLTLFTLIFGCSKEKPNPDPITEYTPCKSYTIDLLGSYDTPWTKTTLIDFIQGKWILDTVVFNTPDPIPDPDSMYVPPNFYVEFLDTIAVIYDLDGHFQAKAPLRITQGQFSEGYYSALPIYECEILTHGMPICSD